MLWSSISNTVLRVVTFIRVTVIQDVLSVKVLRDKSRGIELYKQTTRRKHRRMG